MAVMKIKVAVERCNGCASCSVACSTVKTSRGSLKVAGIRVEREPFVKKLEKPVVCQQCKKPKCVAACANKALTARDNGVIVLTKENCSGCRECIDACPFKAMAFDPASQLPVKCDMCNGREGSVCVQICPMGALRVSG